MTAASMIPPLQTQSESQLAGRYEALFRVSQAISAQRDPKELFSRLANELRQVVKFDFIGVAQYDNATGNSYWLLSECDHPCDEPSSDCAPEQTMTRWVFEHQEPLVIPSVEDETRFPQMTEQLSEYGIRSACALPLTTVHRRVGILALGSEHPDAYSDDEVGFLSLVANQVAVAIDDALNFESSKVAQAALQWKQEELQREKDRLKLLLDVNNSVISNLELREVLRAIVASVRRVMQCDGVGVMLPDLESNRLRIYALDFPESKGFIHEEILFPIEGSVSGKVFLTGKPFVGVRPDPTETLPEAYRLLTGEGIQSRCFLPLISRNHTRGVLALANLQENAFRQEDVDFLM
ncbi:MAG: GAF domain-containing protein, partial [Terriglobia bacterium]